MKAAVLRELNQPLDFLELVSSKNLKVGQIRVSVVYTAICGSQLGEIAGAKGHDPYLPHLLGHEGVGTVIQVFDRQSKFQVGDNVVLHWMKGSGIDAPVPVYLSVLGETINAGQLATFADEIICSENRATKISKGFVRPEYSFIGCSLLTAYGVFKRNLNFEPNSTLLITGIGGIGQSSLLLSKYFQAATVFMFDQNASRSSFAQNIQLFEELPSIDSSPIEFDYIIETTGDSRVIEKSYNLLAKEGTICLVGVTPQGNKICIDPMPLHYGRNIIGSYGGSAEPNIDIPKLTSILSKEDLSKLISNVTSFQNINREILALSSGITYGKSVLSLL